MKRKPSNTLDQIIWRMFKRGYRINDIQARLLKEHDIDATLIDIQSVIDSEFES